MNAIYLSYLQRSSCSSNTRLYSTYSNFLRIFIYTKLSTDFDDKYTCHYFSERSDFYWIFALMRDNYLRFLRVLFNFIDNIWLCWNFRRWERLLIIMLVYMFLHLYFFCFFDRLFYMFIKIYMLILFLIWIDTFIDISIRLLWIIQPEQSRCRIFIWDLIIRDKTLTLWCLCQRLSPHFFISQYLRFIMASF